MLLIGSHVSMSGKEMLVGSKKTALSYGANCMMIYTGAPQNTVRKDVSEYRIDEANEISGIEKIIIHAPYIINLGNPEKMSFGQRFLKEEIRRSIALGASCIVLHPGAHVSIERDAALANIVDSLNKVLTDDMNIRISIETMSGKGTEVGVTLEEIQYILENVKLKDKLGICIDTCHVHDYGYDVLEYINQAIEMFGIDKIDVIHINDSKNERGAHKDRHENIGYGYIGFDILMQVIYDERLTNIPKILETPYVDKEAPYKQEIEMIKNRVFNDWKVEE